MSSLEMSSLEISSLEMMILRFGMALLGHRNVVLLDDNVLEGNETFDIQIRPSPQDEDIVNITGGIITITIEEDPTDSKWIRGHFQTIFGKVNVNVTLSFDRPPPPVPLNVTAYRSKARRLLISIPRQYMQL
jgi:hypothetical protein